MKEKNVVNKFESQEPFHMHKRIKDRLEKDFGEKLSFDGIKQLLESFGLEKLSESFIYRLGLLDLKRGEVESPHFQDSIEIAEIAPELLTHQEDESEEDFKERQDNLRAAAIVHDIGKVGPNNANREQQKAFLDAFNLHFYKNLYLKELSEKEKEKKGKAYEEVRFMDLPLNQAFKHKVHEMVFNLGIAEKDLKLIMEAINEQESSRESTKINAASTIYKLFSAHVYWTYEVLQKENVNEKVLLYASCHHLLDGRNPMDVNIDRLSDADLEAIAAIEIADKYQAIRKRSHIPHEKVMKIYTDSIERKIKINEDLGYVKIGNVKIKNVQRFKDAYLKALNRIDENREVFEKELGLDGASIEKQKQKEMLKKAKKERQRELEKTGKDRKEILKKDEEDLSQFRLSIRNWSKPKE